MVDTPIPPESKKEGPSNEGLAKPGLARSRDASAEKNERGPWRAWLASLGTDASSALAAVETYGALEAEGREAWLTALEEDLAALAPDDALAAYAPLLAVEEDEARRARIVAAMSGEARVLPPQEVRAWSSEKDGNVVVVIARPLVFSFVEVLTCAFARGGAIQGARYVALVGENEVFEGVTDMGVTCTLLPASPDDVIDALAHAIVAHRDHGEPPAALVACAHMFATISARSPEPEARA